MNNKLFFIFTDENRRIAKILIVNIELIHFSRHLTKVEFASNKVLLKLSLSPNE